MLRPHCVLPAERGAGPSVLRPPGAITIALYLGGPIDRIANEGAIFTDYYGQQSCTAGRAAFITGQSPMRTGLLKVGLPAAKEGLSEKDPTIAELLKPQGYATAQFGKTISATATNSCRRSTASTSSSATSIT